jgi:hypothetical protein
MVSEMNPTMYYKLDGSSAITDNFQGGGFRLSNIADGISQQDAVTMNQITTFSSVFYARDGSLPLTNHFKAAGYKLTDLGDGTNSQDGATFGQVQKKFNKDGSEVFQGDLLVGDGTYGGTLTLRARNTYNDPSISFNRKDNGNIFKIYSPDNENIKFGFFNPDSTSPNNPVAEMEFTRGGNLNITGTSHVSEFIESIDSISTNASLNIGLNTNNNSAISFNYNSVYDKANLYFDNIDKAFKIDETSAEEGYRIWHSGNVNPDTFEPYLGDPSSDGQILASTTSGSRYWKEEVKDFITLGDTPNDYTGNAGKLLGVNTSEDGIDFGEPNPNVTRHEFLGDNFEDEFVIPGGYLPGNIDIALDRTRMMVGPLVQGYDVEASDGQIIKFASPPTLGKKIFVTAFIDNKFLVLPNANKTTAGGIKVRIEDLTNNVYITTDGTNP